MSGSGVELVHSDLPLTHPFSLVSACSVVESDGAQVLVDPVSMLYLKGATVTYEEEMIRSNFAVLHNPNVDSECGCKVSFTPRNNAPPPPPPPKRKH